MNNENLISFKDAAEIRGVHKNTIKDLVNRKKLTCIKIGNIKYVDREEILSYIPEKAGRPKKELLSDTDQKRSNLSLPSSASDSNFSQKDKPLKTLIPEDFPELPFLITEKVELMDDDDFLTVAEIAEYLEYSEKRVRRQIHAKRLNATSVGGQYLVTKENLLDYLDWEEINNISYFYEEERERLSDPAYAERCRQKALQSKKRYEWLKDFVKKEWGESGDYINPYSRSPEHHYTKHHLAALLHPDEPESDKKHFKRHFTKNFTQGGEYLLEDVILFIDKYGIDTVINTKNQKAVEMVKTLSKLYHEGYDLKSKLLKKKV